MDNIVNLGSQDVSRSLFRNLTIEGTQGGAGRLTARDCALQDPGAGDTTLHIFAERCGFVDRIQVDTSNDNVFDQCYSLVAGTAAPIIQATGAAGTIAVRHYSGGIEFESLSASHNLSVEGMGQIIFNASCNVNANVSARGIFTVTDNTAGMNSFTQTAVLNQDVIADANWDELIAGHLGAGSTGEALDNASAPTAAQVADAVWDEVLTAATHNVASSSGRRLRTIQEGNYEGGAIWIDTINGTAGTVVFENGTVENPVNNIADANTLATSLGVVKFVVLPASTITFAAAQNNQLFHGYNWTLALGGQDIAGTMIKGATVSGIASGTGTRQIFKNCFLNAVTLIANTHLITCGIMGTITVGEAGDYFMDRCHSAIAGIATWIFDFGGAIGNTNLNVRNYSGGIQVENMGDVGVDAMSLEGQGQFIEGTCTGGTVVIRGAFTTSGINNLTISELARLDVDHIADAIWDELIAGHVGVGSFGEELQTHSTSAEVAGVQSDTDDIQTRLPAALVGGRMDSDIANMQANVITAAAIALDAGQEIADRILARSLASGADGGRTIQDALRVLRNRRADAAGTLTVYEEDDVTPAWTAATTRVAGNPITEIDPA